MNPPLLPCRGGEGLLRRLFEPLGYKLAATRHPLDERFPEWGAGPNFTVGLDGLVRLQDLLTWLYVLVPVLDDDKHYYVGEDERSPAILPSQNVLSAFRTEIIGNSFQILFAR